MRDRAKRQWVELLHANKHDSRVVHLCWELAPWHCTKTQNTTKCTQEAMFRILVPKHNSHHVFLHAGTRRRIHLLPKQKKHTRVTRPKIMHLIAKWNGTSKQLNTMAVKKLRQQLVEERDWMQSRRPTSRHSTTWKLAPWNYLAVVQLSPYLPVWKLSAVAFWTKPEDIMCGCFGAISVS